MTPRRLPLSRDTIVLRPASVSAWDTPLEPVGWTRKAFALALHAMCLALFWLTVVSPLLSPLGRSEVAVAMQPVRQAWAAFSRELPRHACASPLPEVLAAELACPPRF